MRKIYKMFKMICILTVTVLISFFPLNEKNEKPSNKNQVQEKLNKRILKEKIDIPPIIISTTTTFFVACHVEFSLNNFIKYIRAYDEEDGDITDKLFIKTNEYEGNIGKLGEFLLKLGVYDSSNNIATLDLKIVTVDTLPPEIIGPKEIRTYRPLTNNQITSLYSAVDNVDANVVSRIKVVNNTLTGNIPGTYKITLEVTDFSNNKAFMDVTYILLENEHQDDNRIVGKIIRDNNQFMDNVDIFNYLISIGEATLYDEITLTTDYFGNENINGIYEVYVMCKDALGEYRTYILLIEVVNVDEVNLEQNSLSDKKELNDIIKYASTGTLLLVGAIVIRGKKRR